MSLDAAERLDYDALTDSLGLSIDPELLELALTHRSWAHENGGMPTNERLEFLGDSVLGIVVTEELYRANPDLAEGTLAKMRSATVSQKALASVARDHAVGEFVKLGRGELVTGGREKDSILSDTVEALIGAAYLTHGIEPTRAMVLRLTHALLETAAGGTAGLDWKTSLQELAGQHGIAAPFYEVEGTGPDHDRVFTATAIVGTFRGTGTGTSKKAAEHVAAEAAYKAIAKAIG
ncbi:RNAse III [Ruaniaceae bacterium KH17]|nr:RNAse III [Ruaniaceae bacterium KH17]